MRPTKPSRVTSLATLAPVAALATLAAAPVARAQGQLIQVVPVAAELRTAHLDFASLRSRLPITSGTGFAGTQYDDGLSDLSQADQLIQGAGFLSAAPVVARARANFERLYQQIPFYEMDWFERARAVTDYGNALGALRRTNLYLDREGDDETIIVHGLFTDTYFDQRSRAAVYRYGNSECVSRGWAAAEAMDDIPCSHPATDTIECKTTFLCVN
jgi:hypothetical protein